MFDKVLIANRGEIALRVLRACKELGIATVAVHSTADANAMHVRLADESVCIGPPAARDSYLNIPALIAACEITGADAVHPGYGFLSENARFAEILEGHKISFIGPKAEHIRTMGDKIEAKRNAPAPGHPLRPGFGRRHHGRRRGEARGGRNRLPGPRQGGGGRRRTRHEGRPQRGGSRRRPEHGAHRGEGRVRRRCGLFWRSTSRSRGTSRSRFWATERAARSTSGERDCSLQRRHQKVWEEGPSPALNAAERERIGGIVAKAMQDMQYLGAGTIEFLYENGEFYFIEMNTRIQVEHPVTEMITGIDLVNEQIRVAAGSPLSVSQADIVIEGHAIECA